MKRILILALFLVTACSGVYQASGDCSGDQFFGVDCTGLSIHPYETPTPWPITMGRITLGDSWQQFTDPGTRIDWSVVQAAGPVEIANYNQFILVAATVPGEYIFQAAWHHNGIDYQAPFTLTVVAP